MARRLTIKNLDTKAPKIISGAFPLLLEQVIDLYHKALTDWISLSGVFAKTRERPEQRDRWIMCPLFIRYANSINLT